MTEAPYRLFDFYRYEDRDLFFGRDEEVARIVGDILSARLLALFAPSGSGKSSLLRAGVQPALEKRNFDVVFTRVSEDPLAAIIGAVESLKSTPSQGARDLNAALKGRTKPIVIVIDQFEELFIQFGPESKTRTDFPLQLAQALFDDSLRVYFVLSLRSDYFVCLNEFRAAIPTIFHNNANLELQPFDDASALAAIKGPSELPDSSFRWEPGLPERIVADLKAEEINPRRNGVLPITLQVICHSLWSQLPGKNGTITTALYESQNENPNRALGIIERRIGTVLQAVPIGRRRLLCRLLRELTTKDGTKRVRSRKQLHEALGESNRKRAEELLALFQKDLLLREETTRGETWVELRHDYLAAKIRPWLDEEERRLDSRRRRNNTIAAVACAIVAAVGVWLWNDYNTYTAEIGSVARPADPNDELIVSRRAPMRIRGGETNHAFWKFRVETGFPRDVLQDGGIQHNTFNVPNAPKNWAAIGEHLAKPMYYRMVLATRLDSLSSTNLENEKASAVPDTDALKSQDIGYYAAADEKVLSFALVNLTNRIPKVKISAAKALDHLSEKLNADGRGIVISNLLETLNDKDFDVKVSAAEALVNLQANLSAAQAEAIMTNMLSALSALGENFGYDSYRFFDSFGRFAATLSDRHAATVVTTLLNALNGRSPRVKALIADAFGESAENLGTNQVEVVIGRLMGLMKEEDPRVKSSVAHALGKMELNLSTNNAKAVVAVLLSEFADGESRVKRAIADAVNDLEPKLLINEVDSIASRFLDGFRENDDTAKQSIVNALGTVGTKLTMSATKIVVTNLISVLTDDSSDVKSSAAFALRNFGKRVPTNHAEAVLDSLLKALRDSNSTLRRSAAEVILELASNFGDAHADRIISDLLSMVKNRRSENDEVADALTGWHRRFPSTQADFRLPPTQADLFVTKLLDALNDNDRYLREAAAEALANSDARLPSHHLGVVITNLLSAVGNRNYGVRQSALRALTGLQANLSSSQADTVAITWLTNVNEGRIDAFYALSSLGNRFSKIWADATITNLLNTLSDPIMDHSSAYALEKLGSRLSVAQADMFLTNLMGRLNDKEPEVQNSAVIVLGQLGTNVPPRHVKMVISGLANLIGGDDSSSIKKVAAYALTEIQISRFGSEMETVFGGEIETILFRLASLLAVEVTRSEEDNAVDELRHCVRELTRWSNSRSSDDLIHDLESDRSRVRICAIHMLARRNLSLNQLEKIRLLRNDPKSRPWVRMAALDTLMEIEREKDALKKDEERKLLPDNAKPVKYPYANRI